MLSSVSDAPLAAKPVNGQRHCAERADLATLGKKAMEEDAEAKKGLQYVWLIFYCGSHRDRCRAKAQFSRGYGGSFGIEPIRDPQTVLQILRLLCAG